MGSKVIGFRVPDDLAEELERFSSERGQTTSEFLRKLVDDTLYSGSGRERLEKRRTVETHEDLSAVMTRLDNLEQQAKSLDEQLELVQVNRGLTDADKEHYDEALSELEKQLTKLSNRFATAVEEVDKNVALTNTNFRDWGDKVSRLFQLMEAHTHASDGTVKFDPADLFEAEVALADKRLGQLPVEVRAGKVNKPGWKYLEHLNLSIKEKH